MYVYRCVSSRKHSMCIDVYRHVNIVCVSLCRHSMCIDVYQKHSMCIDRHVNIVCVSLCIVCV